MGINENIDFEILEKDIKRFKIIYLLIWVFNFALFVGQFAYYFFVKIELDFVFIAFMLLNVLSLFSTYKINDRYSFLKYRYSYYKKNNN